MFLILMILGSVGLVGIFIESRDPDNKIEAVPRCLRCDGMREWRHRCPDSVELTELIESRES